MNEIPNVPGEETPATTEPTGEDKQWGMIAHFSALAGLVIPFGNIVGPLVVWQLKKGQLPFAEDQAKEALNFQISVTVYLLISFLLIIVLIGIFLLAALGLFALIMTVIAGIKANEGVAYRYPLTFRLVN